VIGLTAADTKVKVSQRALRCKAVTQRAHLMTPKEAEQTISVIRTLMERGTRYTNISSASAVAAGIVTLIGCAVRAANVLPLGEKWGFFVTWSAVFFISLAAIVSFTVAQARRNGEPVWTRQARQVVLSILPAFFTAVILSHILFHRDLRDLLPGTWMLLYGCGALAMSFFTPLSIRVLGIVFMAAGAVFLAFFPGYELLAMGVSFGGIHLTWGLVLALQRQPWLAGRRANRLIVQDR
jgi:hypothetical protein